jgi:hypothetical protein
MSRFRGDLRLIIRDGSRLALAWQTKIEGEDVYVGPRAGERGESFRLSYHASGVTHFYFEGHRLPPGGPSPAPKDVLGWEQIASWSVQPLTWGYKPKPDSPRRLNLIVDSDTAPIPLESWTVTLVAAERDRPEAIEAALHHYRSQELLIAHMTARCAHVSLIGVLWTMSVETWNAVQQQIAARPKPGPRRRAFLREREAFVAAHRLCDGFESGFSDGRTWMACITCGVRIARAAVPDDA